MMVTIAGVRVKVERVRGGALDRACEEMRNLAAFRTAEGERDKAIARYALSVGIYKVM